MKYGVEISETHSIELDVSPNAPALMRVELEWAVKPGELEQRFAELGGREKFSQMGARVWARNVELRRDGECVGRARINLWCVDSDEASAPARVFACSRGGGR